ncbi:TPA: hypothetical protein ACQVHL_005336, partial [Serratia marcescens]
NKKVSTTKLETFINYDSNPQKIEKRSYQPDDYSYFHRTHLISRNRTALPVHARLSSSIFVVDRVGSYLQKNSKLRPAMKQ